MKVSTHYYDSQANDNGLALDLYVPETATANSNLVVFIHGGAWRSEDKADHAKLARQLAANGFTVAAINYRLSLRDTPEAKPSVQHPSHIQDSAKAVEFLTTTPPVSGVYDPSRVTIVGHSAGAHICMMLLLDPTYRHLKLQGVVGADGIYDLPLLIKTFPDYLDFVSQAFGDDQTTYADASPTTKIPETPVHASVLIVHSLDDKLINIAQSDAMVKHLKDLAVNVTLDTTSVTGDHFDMIASDDFASRVAAFVNADLA